MAKEKQKKEVVKQDAFKPNPRIAAINKELATCEEQRLNAKRKGAELKKEQQDLLMVDEITLKILHDRDFNRAELDWVEAHPKEWAAIKKETTGKRGSRQYLKTTAQM